MKAQRTPVWLVTGYLGSGKTTLLSAWLREPLLAHAALIVNEIGEVGLDDRLLVQAVDSANLLPNACLCCTGMQGLQEVLQELWWDRLYRRRPAFGAVVIETTGLADPGPVLEAFRTQDFLRERYCLAGVVTTVAATAGVLVLSADAQAREQVAQADVVVITKTDQANAEPLVPVLQALNSRAAIACSACASLSWAKILALLPITPTKTHHVQATAPSGEQHHRHAHAHDASAAFLPLDLALSDAALQQHLCALRRTPLLRLKGLVEMAGSGLQTVQWSLGDKAVSLTPYDGPAELLGLTYITAI